jgi:hypothetical protein
MPTYTYTARDRTGKLLTATMEANSQRDVAASLRDKGLFVSEIKAPKTGLNMDIKMPAFMDKPGFADVSIFSRQFATVINAGLPVVQSLNILAKQADKQGMKAALGKIRTDVETGMPLSDSMSKHPSIFNKLYIYLVKPVRSRATSTASSSGRGVPGEAAGARGQDPVGHDVPGRRDGHRHRGDVLPAHGHRAAVRTDPRPARRRPSYHHAVLVASGLPAELLVVPRLHRGFASSVGSTTAPTTVATSSTASCFAPIFGPWCSRSAIASFTSTFGCCSRAASTSSKRSRSRRARPATSSWRTS